ncbi:MAG: DUF6114 domain-containing protein [Thaumarchaeota archaeon]|nr:hypothetical protein [Nitrososphaerota archaeon]MCS4539683.1 DUF6114 domain-containing protein [Nitrososphaerota archaeon]
MGGEVVRSYPRGAFTISIVAGVLMVASGLFSLTMAFYGPPFWGWGRGPPWNATGHFSYGPMMDTSGFSSFIFKGVAAFGLVSGVIVLISALMLRSRPRDNTIWGILIVVFSVLSFFGFGGFFVGAVLGIIGGALALGWKPSKV